MTVKEHILKLLENNRGKYYSGQDIAEEINVSRAAVWKAVKQLQADGYRIDAVSNKGYCMSDDNDIISADSIKKYLTVPINNIEVYKTVTSTNDLAKQYALDLKPEGTVIVAREQTAGRGRKGRSFYSPISTGVYISVLLRPELTAEKTLYITTAAAVAVAKAIEKISGKEAKIKWVNDIFVDGKKVCGILTEGAIDFETGKMQYAVLGIGVNIKKPENDFPSEIQNIAGSVFDTTDKEVSSIIVAEILNNFMNYYKNLANKPFYEEYKKRMFLIGKQLTVYSGKDSYPAVAIDLDEELSLIVKDENGNIKKLNTGEVSIKI
ncbi:MAG: biotin--[acetyl-CoA-carboxylase] ligase [Escherichia coli]|nr:MAG: biotin--[acetyl-CoA-carboxylase] ligase [Escherichia coli]